MTTPIWTTLQDQLARWPALMGRPHLLVRMLAQAQDRHAAGLREYGAPLTPDTPIDGGQYASEEAQDLAAYLEVWAGQAGDAEGRRTRTRLKRTALSLWAEIEEERERDA